MDIRDQRWKTCGRTVGVIMFAGSSMSYNPSTWSDADVMWKDGTYSTSIVLRLSVQDASIPLLGLLRGLEGELGRDGLREIGVERRGRGGFEGEAVQSQIGSDGYK